MTNVEVAAAVGISEKAVRKRVKRGETQEQILATGRKDRRQTRVPQEDSETFLQVQLRKEKALADLREIEVAEKRGELISVEQAVNAWVDLVQMTRARMQRIPMTVCERITAMTDAVEVRNFLAAEIDSQLTHLSNDFRCRAVGIETGGGAAPDIGREDDDAAD